MSKLEESSNRLVSASSLWADIESTVLITIITIKQLIGEILIRYNSEILLPAKRDTQSVTSNINTPSVPKKT